MKKEKAPKRFKLDPKAIDNCSPGPQPELVPPGRGGDPRPVSELHDSGEIYNPFRYFFNDLTKSKATLG